VSGFPQTNNLKQIDFQKVDPVARDIPGPIHDSLQALIAAMEQEFAHILERARDHELRLQKAFADATLLSREQAARLLGCSVTQLDRLVTDGKLEVTYFDRRPRFPLVELQRFIAARTGKQPKSRRRCRQPI